MQPVNSTNLSSVGYNPILKELTIEFKKSGFYTYLGVPKHVYLELMSASSKGRYHHQFIKGIYPYK